MLGTETPGVGRSGSGFGIPAPGLRLAPGGEAREDIGQGRERESADGSGDVSAHEAGCGRSG